MASASTISSANANAVDQDDQSLPAQALRALREQQQLELVQRYQSEAQRLTTANAALQQQLREMQDAMATQIDDRERVLAFKSKRIEELLVQVKDYEAVNASLLRTIHSAGGTSTSSEVALSEVGRKTPASIALVQRGEPLFHAVETCKAQEFKRNWDDEKQRVRDLEGQIAAQCALVSEMQHFQSEKRDLEAQIAALQQQIADLQQERDEQIRFLERKMVLDYDRLEKEKAMQLRVCHEDMETRMRTQLDVTTRSAIEENARVQLELRFQSTQVGAMLERVDALQEQYRRAMQDNQMLETMNATLSRRVKFLEQLVTKMQQTPQHAKSELGSNSVSRCETDRDAENETPRVRRKPPLPSLSPPSSPTKAPPIDSSPAIPLELSGDQLNTAADALTQQMQQSAFSRTQIAALLQHRASRADDDSPGGFRTKSSIVIRSPRATRRPQLQLQPRRRGRHFGEPPLTLDAFIKTHVTISPRAPATPRSVDASASAPSNTKRAMIAPLHLPQVADLHTTPASSNQTQTPAQAEAMWSSTSARRADPHLDLALDSIHSARI